MTYYVSTGTLNTCSRIICVFAVWCVIQ